VLALLTILRKTVKIQIAPNLRPILRFCKNFELLKFWKFGNFDGRPLTMTQNAKVDKVLNTILFEDDNEIEKRSIALNKNELATLILFLVSTKSLKEELALLGQIGVRLSRMPRPL
jgi:hypothetical protein